MCQHIGLEGDAEVTGRWSLLYNIIIYYIFPVLFLVKLVLDLFPGSSSIQQKMGGLIKFLDRLNNGQSYVLTLNLGACLLAVLALGILPLRTTH